MIPNTKNNLRRLECISAMQKLIRRGMELEAMQLAVEVAGTDKGGFSLVCNRLEVISHEDIGLADPQCVMFVATAVEQARRYYDTTKPGKYRMMIGNAIRLMCRAQKSREGDHFGIVTGFASDLEGFVPEVPEWTYDHHTARGRQMGRDHEYFIEESTKLVPAPQEQDPYEAEAHRLIRVKNTTGKKNARRPSGSQLF